MKIILTGKRPFTQKVLIFTTVERLTSGIIVKSTYGREITSNDDDYVKLATNSVSAMTYLGVPGLNLVDLFPLCES